MTKCKQEELGLPSVNGKRLKIDFSGGSISSDGGLALIRAIDDRIGLSKQVCDVLTDKRQRGKIEHKLLTMLRERLYGMCAGWEDLNDFNEFRDDTLLQSLAGSDTRLAGASTLCRWENAQDRQSAIEVNRVFVEQFISSHTGPPKELILDFDATDDPVHGNQEGRFFHGYYRHYCFLPLYVFCGKQLLVSYLRPSNIDASKHSSAITKLLVKRLREQWPDVRIIIRADSGFCRKLLLDWCDRNDVGYVIGIARNKRLEKLGAALQEESREAYERTDCKQRLFQKLSYGAHSWGRERTVIHKAEHTSQGGNPRFIITNIEDDPQKLYDETYCVRGDMENRIKEQLMLFSDRTSAHRWWANQWRLLLSSMAYTLFEAIRRIGLKGTSIAKAQCSTIMIKLIKIGAIVTRNTRTIRLHMSEAYPLKNLFAEVLRKLMPT